MGFGGAWRRRSPKRCKGLCAQEFPQVFKREFTKHNKQCVGQRSQAQIPQKRQLKVIMTFSIKFWGLPFEGTQTTPARKVQPKQTLGARARSQLPWLSARKNRQKETKKNPGRNLL